MTDGTQARPQGVTIFAILAIVNGAFGILGGLLGSALGAVFAMAGAGTGLGLVSLISLGMSVAWLVLGIGALTLKPWTWPATIIVQAISVLIAILTLNILGIPVAVVIAGVIIWYLDKPHVRAVFAAPAQGFPVVGTSVDRYIPWKRAGV